ncbi:hypothetical protein G6F70_000695 [Rhizopus microsporus]|uniref:Pyrroloquinoline quinone-dependent pyranose dehydrogenase beta-propeller domain-containing protein n=1 Tax=Rhizopus azygosporus TaxID=86630 RepID=A0A367IX12_RHIAZ|nr:hypothetical protein G6F71_001031 [Rhizopus microsporus]RCH82218.1 hypothetical protein CU097_004901 [Rhizopus azygosporus]KAG1204205.1 hypothetical protein G6F70_000695 [Rhizopus microsporus]KAG1215434.1 hypothetical protein G6F69_001032 [Rhizopus microsporus]KAG1238229.1 hypothetical protein G6F67_000596 [Rhizopus microsporus]
MKKQIIFLSTLFLLFALTFAKNSTKPKKSSSIKSVKSKKSSSIKSTKRPEGSLEFSAAVDVIIPDASAENPIILSNVEDQPLCKPDVPTSPVKELKVMPGYDFFVLTNKIEYPRKLLMDRTNHLLVVSPERGLYSIRMDKCGNSDIMQILDGTLYDEKLGTGVAIYGQHIFVATETSIYRFPYSDGQHSPLVDGVKVMSNLNPLKSTEAPDIVIDVHGSAFIPRSVTDIDDKAGSTHAVIKKFNFRDIPQKGYDFDVDGEFFAFGTNTQGLLGFDVQSQLWGLNGLPKDIKRTDIHPDQGTHPLLNTTNPYVNFYITDLSLSGLAEELNKYAGPGNNYGFPYCYTEHSLEKITELSKGRGGQWGNPVFLNESFALDAYCLDERNNRVPEVPLPPKSYASNVHFYSGTFCSVGDLATLGTSVGLPCNWTNTPIIANHGFDNQPEGHSVVHIPFYDLGHKPRLDLDVDVILEASQPCGEGKCFAPYGLAVDQYGRLYVSSDETNEIVVVTRNFSETAAREFTDKVNALEDSMEDSKEQGDDEKSGKDDDKNDKGDDKDDKGDDKNDKGDDKDDKGDDKDDKGDYKSNSKHRKNDAKNPRS